MRPTLAVFAILALSAAACTKKQVAVVPPPKPEIVKAAPETVTVRDPDLERRAARLELQIWEADAQNDELQQRLDEARDEVVRAMAKLASLATRAEAGSGMAEADVVLEQIRATGQQTPELRQATELMTRSTAEFNKQNYGGALYLANQAKTVAAAGGRRLAAVGVGPLRPGEVLFALPVGLKATGRANIREGPGTNTAVTFTAESGDALTGLSYLGDWVRVTDDGGRTGWVVRSLLARR